MNNKKLRDQAEQILQNEQQLFTTNEVNTLREALHELNVSQIELSLQNDELQRANLQLQSLRITTEKLQDKYKKFFNTKMVGFIIIDSTGVIQECNIKARDLLIDTGLNLTRRQFADLFEETYGLYWKMEFKAFHESEKDSLTLLLKLRDENNRNMYVEALTERLVEYNNTSSRYYQISLINVTQRILEKEQLENKLEELTQKLKQIESN